MQKFSSVIFDVNETLLDLSPLKQRISGALGDPMASDLWFSELLHYSLVESSSKTYHDFSEIGAAVFKMLAEKFNKKFQDEEIKDILATVKNLEPYPDVEKTLKSLSEKNIGLVAFSNGKASVLEEQLANTGLDIYFNNILSVEGCGKYKPHYLAYKYVLDEIGTSAKDSMMVAAHGWDIAGAERAGMKTAFIKRKGKSLYPLAKAPDLQIDSLMELLPYFQ